MDITFSNKIDLIPQNLIISKDSIWQLINKVSSIIIVDINDLTILFANPNALKILQLIDQDVQLDYLSILGKKFKYPVTYGEISKFVARKKDGHDALIEIRSTIVTWDNTPAYLLLLNSFTALCKDCKFIETIETS